MSALRSKFSARKTGPRSPRITVEVEEKKVYPLARFRGHIRVFHGTETEDRSLDKSDPAASYGALVKWHDFDHAVGNDILMGQEHGHTKGDFTNCAVNPITRQKRASR